MGKNKISRRKQFEFNMMPHHKYLVRGQDMFFLEWDGLTAIFYHYSGGQIVYFRDRDLMADEIVKTNGLCTSNPQVMHN